MIKKTIAIILCLFSILVAGGQDLQELLDKVAQNNPEIIAYKRLLEARKLEARTGITPSDPVITAGYMPGKPDAIGTKKIWSVVQSFDFPTRYLLQKRLNMSTLLLAEQEFNHGRLLKLLDAEMTAFSLVYNSKLLDLLNTRKERFVRLESAWKKMLDSGEATILDYNRIMMEISVLDLEITNHESNTYILKEKLAYMSGGDTVNTELSDYPPFNEPEPEQIISEKSSIHPAFLMPEIETQISTGELKLSRTGSLPGFQVGYSSEIVPGQNYTGPVAGITIPLWANSNRIRTASAAAEYSYAVLDAGIMRLKSEIRREYTGMKALKTGLNNAREILQKGEGSRFADTALQNGEISITTYFNYLEANYETEERVLELEYEYYRSLASLLDYELIRKYLSN